MRLDVRLDRAQVVPVRSKGRSSAQRDGGRVGEGGRVELAAAKRPGQHRGSRQEKLCACLRWGPAAQPNHRCEQHFLPEGDAPRQLLFDARH